MDIRDLVPRQKYKVIKEFKDDDQIVHPVGETWFFSRTTFVPYHSGLVLHVYLNEGDTQETVYGFWCTPEGHDHIVGNFHEYVQAVKEQ